MYWELQIELWAYVFRAPLIAAPAVQCGVQVKAPDSPDNHPAGEDPNALTALDIERLDKGIAQTLAALNIRLQDLHSLLQSPPQVNFRLLAAVVWELWKGGRG